MEIGAKLSTLLGLLIAVGGFITLFRAEAEFTVYISLLLIYIGSVIIGGIPSFDAIKSIVKIPLPILFITVAVIIAYIKLFTAKSIIDDVFGWAVGFFFISVFANQLTKFLSD